MLNRRLVFSQQTTVGREHCVWLMQAFQSLFLSIFLGPLSPTLVAKFTPVELTLIDQQELGYMPLRDDFERVSIE